MAANAIQETLSSIVILSDQKQKGEQYRTALASALTTGSKDVIAVFIDHMLSDAVPLVLSRQLLLAMAQDISKLPPEQQMELASMALEKLSPRVVSFEECVTLLREGLAGALEKQEQWSKAAHCLAAIDLDSGQRAVDPVVKLRQHIRIAMLFLEDEDPVSAEVHVKKAAVLIANCKDPALELQYKVCYARILDSKRRFLEAALRYYELSSLGASSGAEGAGATAGRVSRAELEHALSMAITCTILGAAGPQRSRLLSVLFKDERVAALPVFPFLEKVYMERILRREEVQAFAQGLAPHQTAVLPDGSTVLERAVMQHNLLAASKLYNNISTTELGTLLGVTTEKAEGIAADMIAEGRLHGLIDQVAGLVIFTGRGGALQQWDAQLVMACEKINNIVDALGTVAAAVPMPV